MPRGDPIRSVRKKLLAQDHINNNTDIFDVLLSNIIGSTPTHAMGIVLIVHFRSFSLAFAANDEYL
jgi:hypothetical protein